MTKLMMVNFLSLSTTGSKLSIICIRKKIPICQIILELSCQLRVEKKKVLSVLSEMRSKKSMTPSLIIIYSNSLNDSMFPFKYRGELSLEKWTVFHTYYIINSVTRCFNSIFSGTRKKNLKKYPISADERVEWMESRPKKYSKRL